MRYKPGLALAGLLSLGLLAGCGSDNGVTMFEPGVYKGKQDATASEEAAERRSDDLRNRADSAFADR